MSSNSLNSLSSKRLVRKKNVFKQDPIVVLTYVVLLGVLLSGFTSFGF